MSPKKNPALAPEQNEEDARVDTALRPQSLGEFIGQEKLKENLKVFIEAARRRKEPLDHALFYSPPGLGKTTLASILAREMGVNLRTTSGPILDRVGDLAAILTDLAPGDVLFIDEIHRLNRLVEESLYPVMEDFTFYISTGKGPMASTVKLAIPRFTLVGATTRAGLLTGPMRDRFGISGHLGFYTLEELTRIALRSASILKIQTDPKGAEEIARRSRGTPRIANRLLRRVRDFAEVRGSGVITHPAAVSALESLEVDAIGLDAMDRRLLRTLCEKFSGGPVGLENLAVAVHEEVDTLTDVVEPYLVELGFLQHTPRGRIATDKAFEHLGLPKPKRAAELF
ncbi:MAG TPA: Holliday junction branch migration DNA helicase RuvB [Elusimicrobia bacterium]|nr:Holliday junction branch migration DNA helicase RuvB [Elusimicrobiota bacterium]